MKRGQSTLEYVFLIGVVGVAVTAMLVYINRGFQGNIRSSANQIGAGQYEPGSTITNNSETKHVTSKTVSESITKTQYGIGGENPRQFNLDQQSRLRSELAALQREIVAQTASNPILNQTAIDARNAINGINNAGIGNATTFTGADGTVYGLTDAQRATQLNNFGTTRESMNTQLNGPGGLVNEQTTLVNTSNRTPDQQSRLEALPGLITSLRSAISTLDAGRPALADAHNPSPPLPLTSGNRVQVLNSVSQRILEIDTQLNGRHGLVYAYGVLSSDETRLANLPHRTPTEQIRLDALPGLMAENQSQQTALRAALEILNTQKQVLLAGGNITGFTIDTTAITPVVTPVVLPRTLADINAVISTKTQELAGYVAAYANLPAQSNQGVTSRSTSKNVEKGTITIQRNSNEKLGSL